VTTKNKKSKKKKVNPQKRTRIDKILSYKYFPLILLLILSLIYFYRYIFTDVTILTSDGGLIGTTGSDLRTGIQNPFKEDRLWGKYFLGGQPTSQGLSEYTRNIFTRVLFGFFPRYKAYGIYLVIMTACAGFFLYIFLRSLKISRKTGLIISVCYMFAPVYMSFTYAGHFSKMGVIALTPLLFYLLEKGINTPKPKYYVYLAAAIAITVGTAHLQFVYFSFLSLGLYFIFRLYQKLREKDYKIVTRKAGLFIFAVVLGLGISARVFLPPYIHTKTVSKRAVEAGVENAQAESFSASWSLHPEEVGSFVVPEFGNYFHFYWGRNPFKINSEYFGMLVVLFSILSLYLIRRNSYVKFFLGLGLFGLLFALGPHTPVHGICFRLIPGMQILRAPSQFAFIIAFSASIMAAFALDKIFTNERNKELNFFKYVKYFLFAVIGFSLLFFIVPGVFLNIWTSILYPSISEAKLGVMQHNIHELKEGLLLFMLFSGIMLAFVKLSEKNKAPLSFMFVGFLLIVLVDTWRIDKQFLRYSRVPDVIKPYQEIPAYEYIKKTDKSYFRVFPYHAIRAGDTRFQYEGLSMITGFADFTLKRYDDLMQEMTLGVLNRYGNE